MSDQEGTRGTQTPEIKSRAPQKKQLRRPQATPELNFVEPRRRVSETIPRLAVAPESMLQRCSRSLKSFNLTHATCFRRQRTRA